MRYASGQTDRQTDTLIATVQFTPVSKAKYIKLSAASSEIIILHFSGEDFVNKNCLVGPPTISNSATACAYSILNKIPVA